MISREVAKDAKGMSSQKTRNPKFETNPNDPKAEDSKQARFRF
jgi:hypothetical protein